MSLYKHSKTKVKVGSDTSEEFYVVVGVYQGSVFSPLLFAIVVNVLTKNAREGLMKEVLYADDLVLMSEMMKGLKKRFLKWRSALESKGLNVNFKKTKVMVYESEGKVIQNRIDPCGIRSKRVTLNSVLCTKCDQCIHGRCSKLKKVTLSVARLFVCIKSDKETNHAGEVK